MSQAGYMLTQREKDILRALGIRPGTELARKCLELAERPDMTYWHIVLMLTGSAETATRMFGPKP